MCVLRVEVRVGVSRALTCWGPVLSDVDALQEMLRGRPERLRDQASTLRLEDEALELESHRHGDMVFVDVIDTYRSVPSKLLQFYNWYESSNDLNGMCEWVFARAQV